MNENKCLALIHKRNASDEDRRFLRNIVYVLTNLLNGKRYVGVTTLSFYERYRKTQNNWEYNASNEHLQNAFRKYGIHNFHVQIVISNATVPLLDILERFFIKFFDSTNSDKGYNMSEGGFSNTRFTPAARLHMSEVRRKSYSQFVNESEKIHGKRYDYSQVIYMKNETKVIIICRDHGPFLIRPSEHLYNKYGCPVCENRYARLTQQIFIKRANQKHKEFYTYKLAQYSNNSSPVIITCPKHGNFKQAPANHLNGQRCPKCAGYIKLTTKTFIERSNTVHNNFYTYDKTIFIRTSDKVIITCPIHGDFRQVANSHLQGGGCARCAGCLLNNDDFIKTVAKRHNNQYDYSLVSYKKLNIPITIICKQHGYFLMTPRNHLNGNGCKICGLNKVTALRSKSVKQLDPLSKKIVNIFPSLVKATSELLKQETKLNFQGISRACYRKSQYKGYFWEFVS